MDLQVEEWRTIPSHPAYEASSLGKVRRAESGRELRLHVRARDGYVTVSLGPTGKQRARKVHHLVLEAFVGPMPAWAECARHMDGVRSNNAKSNLRWGTHAENQEDKRSHARPIRRTRPTRPVNAKISESDVEDIVAAILGGEGVASVARRYLVSKTSIRNVLKGKTFLAVARARVSSSELRFMRRKALCIRGHDLAGDNLYVNPSSGKRACKACQAEHSRRHEKTVRRRGPLVDPAHTDATVTA